MYTELPGYEELRKALDFKLAEYNEMNTSMDLVLFQQVHTPPVILAAQPATCMR